MTNTERTDGLVSPAQKGKETMTQSVSTSTQSADEPICQHQWWNLPNVTYCPKCKAEK